MVVESVPWGSGKHQTTATYAWFLARSAKRMSWSQVAEAFQASWDRIFRSVEMAVGWGLARRKLSGVQVIGIDEVLWHRGYKFLTVVYQIDEGMRRLLWVGKDRRTGRCSSSSARLAASAAPNSGSSAATCGSRI